MSEKILIAKTINPVVRFPFHFSLKRMHGYTTLYFMGITVKKRGDFTQKEKEKIIDRLLALELKPERAN